MKCKWCIAMVVAVAMGICSAAWAESASVLLEKGIYTEETVGDLDGAIKIYKQIVNDTEADRQYVAEALYRLGICYHKKGQEQEALAVFEELIARFPNRRRPLLRFPSCRLCNQDSKPSLSLAMKKWPRLRNSSGLLGS